MRGRTLTVRTIALLGAAAAAIHQLRYAIGYGNGASHALAAHPHGYLTEALPGVGAAMVLALAVALMRLARGGPARRAQTRLSLASLWLGCALALAAIFAVQETLEGASAITGGGWIGLALAVPAGMLVALALRGADAAEVGAAAGMRHPQIWVTATPVLARPGRAGRLLDLRVSARAPPSALVV